MQRPFGALGCAWIVGDHHDRLAVISIERLKQIQNFIARFAIEVARRLVAQQQGWVGHDRTRNPDALFLPA